MQINRILDSLYRQRSRSCILDRHVQLFREWLTEKVQATIPKGIVGGFDKQTMVREAKDVICEC